MKKFYIVLATFFLLGFGDSHYFAIREGNENYRKQDYEEALKLYRRAQVGNDSDVARYNLGNTYYRQKEYDKAAEMYGGAIKSKNKELSSGAIFNYGNAQFNAGKQKEEKGADPGAMENFQKAAAAYRKTLLGNPSNAAAKHNLELALKKIKEQKKKSEKKKDSQDKEKNEKDGDGKDGDNRQKAGEEGQDKENKKQRAEKGDKQKKRKLNKEDVDRILQALAQNEEKVQKEIRKRGMKEKNLEKDW